MKYINAHETKIEISHFFLCEKEEGESVTLEEIEQVIDRMDSADVGETKHITWIPTKLEMPEDNVPVNITWVNRNPVSYYSHIKDKPFTATGVHFYGKWYWFSSTVTDMLAEYGKCAFDEIDDDIEVIAWMPLPEPYEEKEKQDA